MGRAPCCDKANVKKGPWSSEEDAKLKAYIEQYGTGGNWIALPQKIGLKRCGKSCRLRWLNYLRPNLKHGGFSEAEDNIICSLYISMGSRWSIIAAQLPGRTDNDIKNYWNTKLKKKLLGRRKDPQARCSSTLNQDPKVANGMDENPYSQPLSNSVLERLQLHVQLQSLQNPFSFYNNPALWPKLHPLGDRILQVHHGLNYNTQMQQVHNTQIGPCKKVVFDSTCSNPKQEELDNSLDGFSMSESFVAFNSGSDPVQATIMSKSNGIEQSNTNFQPEPGLQAELNERSFEKTGGITAYEDQITKFDYFKEMDAAEDGLSWWANDVDAKSSSSNLWDSASILQPERMFQDYVLGYNI